MDSSDNTTQIVKDMAKLVMVSGKLSEMHEKNMKTYPLIFFNGVKEAKVEYDVSHKANALVDKDSNLTVTAPTRNNFVSYHLKIEENADNPNMERRYAALEASIKTLFWKDIKVEIHINDICVYKSKQ